MVCTTPQGTSSFWSTPTLWYTLELFVSKHNANDYSDDQIVFNLAFLIHAPSLDAAKHLLNFLCLCVVSGFPVALIPQCFIDTY